MDVKKILTIIVVLTVLAGSGCAKEAKQIDTQHQHQAIVYENPEVGLRVYETLNWAIDKDTTRTQSNVMFANGNLKAIITMIPNSKSFEEIKQELKIGAGKVTVITETDDYLAFQSDRQESIRTDIYISEHGGHIAIITFMTPLNDYESNLGKMESFKSSVELYR